MIDTVEISHKLQDAGLPQKQAEAIAQAFLEVPQIAELATKLDIADVRTEIAKVKAELIYWFLGAFLLNAVAQLIAAYVRH